MTTAPLTPQDVFSTIPSDHRGTFVRLAEQRAKLPEGLGPEHEARFNALQERRAAAEAARAQRAAAESLPPSPEQLLKAEEEEIARLEREEADAAAWQSARQKYGKGRVAMVPTPLGAIILRVMSLVEQDTSGQRINALDDIGQRNAVGREVTLDTVVHPVRDKAREITTTFPGLWVRLYQARDALAVGEGEKLQGKA